MPLHREKETPVVLKRRRTAAQALLATTLLAMFAGLLIAEPPAAPQVSAFAPAEDILSQVDYYVERLPTYITDKEDYTASNQRRVKKDASTLTALLLALSLHDQDHRLKESAASLTPLSQSLADSSDDYDTAAAALTTLADALQNGATGGPTPAWQRVTDLQQLMKQVPTIHNRLRRSLKESRFEKEAAKSAGYAAALAVIAQTAMADTREAKDPTQSEKWFQFCAEMRDTAGAVNSAIRANDFKAATAAATQLKNLCQQCHDVFRPDLK